MKENGFEYVDLGLPSGTMWATCNVGATKSEEVGHYFQFGGSKYNLIMTEDIPPTCSNKKYKLDETLDLNDDAAHVNMGGSWRMPNVKDIFELQLNTKAEIVNINNVEGTMFTSKINNNKLFIPHTGYWNLGKIEHKNCGFIWSNNISLYNNNFAYAFEMERNVSNLLIVNTFSFFRCFGMQVRGVFKK